MATAAAHRRAMREQLNRTLVLDAAEAVFAERGYEAASVRDIAGGAGFSTGALYLFFRNKEDLYGEVLVRRGTEMQALMRAAATGDGTPLQRLHRMADAALDCYLRRPHFARLVAHAHAAMLGSPLAEWQHHPDARVRQQFEAAMAMESDLVLEGQAAGQIRAGSPRALAHLFSVIVNSYLAVGADDERDGLTVSQLHAVIDGAFRADRAPEPQVTPPVA